MGRSDATGSKDLSAGEHTDSCTAKERKFLDEVAEAEAVFLYFDKGPSTITWMRGMSLAPATYDVDYAHVDGKRQVRRLKLTMGLTAKQFAEAVKRGEENDA